MSQTEEDVIILKVSTDTSGKAVIVTDQSRSNTIVVSAAAPTISASSGGSGTPGADGLSAYEVWVSQGNQGSVQDYLNSLVGSTGPQGPAGPQGQPGEQGPAGPQGQPGADGATGATGPQGSTAYQVWAGLNNNGTVEDFFESLRGPQGIQGIQGPPGSDGTEVLTTDIVVHLPNGGNFGKYSHGLSIPVGDGTKTAIDIIREALAELGQVGTLSATASPAPENVHFSTAPYSSPVTITSSANNTNYSVGSTLTFYYYKKVGINGSYTLVNTDTSPFQNTSYPYLASSSYIDSLDFSFDSEIPSNEWIYFKVIVQDSQNSSVSEKLISFEPEYDVPTVSYFVAERTTNSSNNGESNNNRTRFNGESKVRFRIKKNSELVNLDRARIYYNNGSGYSFIGNYDLSSATINSSGYTDYLFINHDAGFVEIGSTNSYKIIIWDDQRPYLDESSPICDDETYFYQVNRIPLKMILSSTSLNETNSTTDWQFMFNGSSPGHFATVQVDEQLTTDGDFLDENTEELIASFVVPANPVGKHIYFFIPSYYFSDPGPGNQDILGPGNPYIDLFHSWNGNEQYPAGVDNVIAAPGVINTDYTLFKEDLPLVTQFGDSSHTTNYMCMRLLGVLGNNSLGGTQCFIRNNE